MRSVRFYVSQADIDIGKHHMDTATRCVLATSLTRHGFKDVSVGTNVGSVLNDDGSRKRFTLSPKSAKAIRDIIYIGPDAVKPFHARLTFDNEA